MPRKRSRTVPGADSAPVVGRRLAALLRALKREAKARKRDIAAASPEHRASALNLAHYLGLRQQDVSDLQIALSTLGLSSLGRSEGHVRDTLMRLERWLRLEASSRSKNTARADATDRGRALRLLRENTRALLGPQPAGRHVYVMVTAPSAAEATRDWADSVIRAGADLIRINAAHETAAEWLHIVQQVRASSEGAVRPVRVFVDLPGPKLRAEIRRTQPSVLHYPRTKDRLGRTVGMTPVAFAPRGRDATGVPLPRAWFAAIRAGDTLRLVDASGRERSLRVADASNDYVQAETALSLYLTGGLPVTWHRGRKLMGTGRIGTLAREPVQVALQAGACFLLDETGRGTKAGLPVLTCPVPGLLRHVRRGERVVLDDGRVVARVESVSRAGLVCRVMLTAKPTLRLKSGKGIAFPDSRLRLPALGPQDEAALEFAMEHADGVDVSFVNSAGDVARIIRTLKKKAAPGFGLVLKLETRGAIRNLPEILFAALRYRPAGLMIARGDLAVEAGFGSLAELQEEILGFGEAAHLPVIWATQVLDSLAHSGVPTRAEVTDAAMSMRAECVMLNKGPHVADAVRMLAGIIQGMEPRQFKKLPLFRRLAESRKA